MDHSFSRIGVGIVGASAHNPGWAVRAHIPAIAALPDDFVLRAVSTRSQASADAAQVAFGVPAFHGVDDLVRADGVDLVVVAVKVPQHFEIVSAALDAGKMVLCEWPLGRTLDEAERLADLADAKGVRTLVGLQGRYAPAVRHAKALIRDGYVGEVLATTLLGSATLWNGVSQRAQAYVFDAAQGANVLSVSTLHALDALHDILGEFRTMQASTALRRPRVWLADEAVHIEATAADHVAIHGQLDSGALASVFYRGGVSRARNLRWEINGSDGDLLLTADLGNLPVADIRLQGGRGSDSQMAPICPSAEIAAGPGGVAGDLGANTLRLYADFARDLRTGSHNAPDFRHAVKRHRELAALERSARS